MSYLIACTNANYACDDGGFGFLVASGLQITNDNTVINILTSGGETHRDRMSTLSTMWKTVQKEPEEMARLESKVKAKMAIPLTKERRVKKLRKAVDDLTKLVYYLTLTTLRYCKL